MKRTLIPSLDSVFIGLEQTLDALIFFYYLSFSCIGISATAIILYIIFCDRQLQLQYNSGPLQLV